MFGARVGLLRIESVLWLGFRIGVWVTVKIWGLVYNIRIKVWGSVRVTWVE